MMVGRCATGKGKRKAQYGEEREGKVLFVDKVNGHHGLPLEIGLPINNIQRQFRVDVLRVDVFED